MYNASLQQIGYSLDILNKRVGAIGEKVSFQYLIKNGYSIIDTNWTCRWGELDIVAIKANSINFFEVKTRSNSDYGSSFESITFYKRRALLRAINNYLVFNNMQGKVWTLDLLGVELRQSKYQLYHWHDILS